MPHKRLGANALTALGTAAVLTPLGLAQADTIQLTGLVRDFKISHPDMEYPHKHFGVVKNLVKNDLGLDHTPVLDTSVDYNQGMISGPEAFAQWFHDTPGVNISVPLTITLDNGKAADQSGGVYSFARERPEYFFPMDGRGWADTNTDSEGKQRNFYFTYEIHTEFTYTDPADRDNDLTFSFTGDDDVWAFINGRKAVDIGGVHSQAKDAINLDKHARDLGLKPGQTYPLDFFFAERHTTQSNFRIETTLDLKSLKPATVSPLYD